VSVPEGLALRESEVSVASSTTSVDGSAAGGRRNAGARRNAYDGSDARHLRV